MSSFLPYFDAKWSEVLRHRSHTFRKALELVERREPPYRIVETGCMRVDYTSENARNDGSSTLLFDEFVVHHGGEVIACELRKEHAECAAKHCSERTIIMVGDAVNALRKITEPCDLLYLDSFDLEWQNPHPSALHHLHEMASASPLLKPGSLVLLDDCGPDGGKGLYVSNWLHRIGATPVLRHYQYLWEMPS